MAHDGDFAGSALTGAAQPGPAPTAAPTAAHPPVPSSALTTPRRTDGRAYRYEMLYAGLARRAYADEATDLTAALIDGYAEMDEGRRWQARLALAGAAQVSAQAQVNAAGQFHRASATERDLLTGTRHEPPVVPTWDCPVPLVLVATYYEPAGRCPRPGPSHGMPPNVIWIDPSDDLSLLLSLHDVGVLALHEAE